MLKELKELVLQSLESLFQLSGSESTPLLLLDDDSEELSAAFARLMHEPPHNSSTSIASSAAEGVSIRGAAEADVLVSTTPGAPKIETVPLPDCTDADDGVP
ncbi:hypothetical protein AX16_002558 [Volvariella volvacea WC 439]|nr:hypothetical protein AX16_002558 [Volvariella volvacea WC 439]